MEEMPSNLGSVKGVVDSDDLLPLNFNRETLQESKTIKVISKKLLRKAIDMLHTLAEKDEFKEDKDDNIDDKTKEVDINKNGELVETENGELVVDAANNTPPHQDAPNTTTTTAAATEEGEEDDSVGAEEGGDNNDVVAEDGDNDDESDDTNGGGRSCGQRRKRQR